MKLCGVRKVTERERSFTYGQNKRFACAVGDRAANFEVWTTRQLETEGRVWKTHLLNYDAKFQIPSRGVQVPDRDTQNRQPLQEPDARCDHDRDFAWAWMPFQ